MDEAINQLNDAFYDEINNIENKPQYDNVDDNNYEDKKEGLDKLKSVFDKNLKNQGMKNLSKNYEKIKFEDALNKLNDTYNKNLRNKGMSSLNKNKENKEKEDAINKLNLIFNKNLKNQGMNGLSDNKVKADMIDAIEKLNSVFNKNLDKRDSNKEEKEMDEAINQLNNAFYDEINKVSNYNNISSLPTSNIIDSNYNVSAIPKEYDIEDEDEYYIYGELDNNIDANENTKRRNWAFIKILLFISYQKNNRLLKKYFDYWRKLAGIAIRDDQINIEQEFDH